MNYDSPLDSIEDIENQIDRIPKNIWYFLFMALSVYIWLESVITMILHFATLKYRDGRTLDIQPIPHLEKLSLLLEGLDIITFLLTWVYVFYCLVWFYIINLDSRSKIVRIAVLTVGIGIFTFFSGFNMFSLLFD